MEIGSIYEIEPASFGGCSGDDRQSLIENGLGEIKKYHKKNCVYTASGREAIALALKGISRLRPGLPKRCLLPAYMCDTVFFPFENEGWELEFYHLNKELAVDGVKLREQIEKTKPGLLFIHPYYGVDTWHSMRSWIGELRAQGICVMEDVTQSYYLEGAGMEADYVVGSLRKWYPVPDGGFVVSDEPLMPEGMCVEGICKEDICKEGVEESGADASEYVQERLRVLVDKWEYLNSSKSAEEKAEDKSSFLKRNRDLEKQLDEYAGVRLISNEAAYILKRINEDLCRKQRSINYNYLYDKLKLLSGIAPILPVNGKEICQKNTAPLYLAVYAADRDELQSFLSARGVYAPVLWPVGSENESYLTADEKYIYEHMLALPIDQRYGIKEMEYIAEAVSEYENSQTEVIGIRADANEEVAMGHIMRCITIAGELKKLGRQVIFFTADEYAQEFLTQAGMEYVCLHSEWNNLEKEIPILRDALEKKGCKKLLVDSYYAGAEYFDKLSDLCKLIYIDDCFEDIYPVDMLINYNAYHVRFNYEEAYRVGAGYSENEPGEEKMGEAQPLEKQPGEAQLREAQLREKQMREKQPGKKQAVGKRVRLLLGTAYVPLRSEFSILSGEEDNISIERDRTGNIVGAKDAAAVRHVLISSGGGDIYNALSGILSEAVKDAGLKNVIFHTVAGKFNPNIEELEQLAEENSNILIHYDVKNMSELMFECGAAVSAAGTMLFELSAMQVPSVFFVAADNQQYDSEFFAKENRMLFAGDIRLERQECIARICGALKQLLNDEQLCNDMKKALREVTDGRGAERIAAEIAGMDD